MLAKFEEENDKLEYSTLLLKVELEEAKKI